MRLYNIRMDRLITIDGPESSYGGGMHNFVMDEVEFGARVAMALDDPEQWWWEIHRNEIYASLDPVSGA